MRDRLGDVKQPEPDLEKGIPTKKEKKDKDNTQSSSDAADAEAQTEFFDQVAQIKDAISSIKTNIEVIEGLHQKALNVISEDQSAQNAKELERVMDKTNKIAADIRNKLKNMETENKKLAKSDKNTSDLKVRINQHGVITKKFIEIMTEYKDVQKKYQEKYKQRLQRQFLVVQPNAKPEEIEKMLDAEQGPVFAQQILKNGQKAEAQRALQDIQDRHQDMVRIERSILELQQLFIDMAVLVSAQGELMNQIEVHMASAVDNTEQGVQALHKAVKLQKKTRKKTATWQNTVAATLSTCELFESGWEEMKCAGYWRLKELKGPTPDGSKGKRRKGVKEELKDIKDDGKDNDGEKKRRKMESVIEEAKAALLSATRPRPESPLPKSVPDTPLSATDDSEDEVAPRARPMRRVRLEQKKSFIEETDDEDSEENYEKRDRTILEKLDALSSLMNAPLPKDVQRLYDKLQRGYASHRKVDHGVCLSNPTPISQCPLTVPMSKNNNVYAKPVQLDPWPIVSGELNINAMNSFASTFSPQSNTSFIWRDCESCPDAKQLLLDINLLGNNLSYENSSIDYRRMEERDVFIVNQFLALIFWDGIDVSEFLAFPSLSVVVFYKSLLIGCAFISPENYITYIAVKPGWQGCGIAKVMLYILIGRGKGEMSSDVVLHVSANNRALILYQKFGFKPEEFIVGFYSHYLPEESEDCKNAFFVRLRR
ncbi:Syntaxin-1A [Nowakowskiella sp. JEL0407]|nr:Syntaxin-1A [Nowakowskiella sp. JEL0407]